MRLKERGMSTSAEPLAVTFDDDSFFVELDDGRTIGVPLAWFPRLFHATPKQRDDFYLSRSGIHWEELDEDVSVSGLLAGQGDLARERAVAA
jgi:hypothetical protein